MTRRRRAARVWAGAGVWILCASCALAQPAGPDTSELTAVERQAADSSLSSREREAAADRAVEVRGALIKAAAEDEPRLTGWLIDQAGALLARLGRDGADSAVLFGIPLPAQRETAGAGAREATVLLERAAKRAEAAAKALAAQNIAPEDPRASAVEQDRTVRIPFFRARADVIQASLGSGVERVRYAEAAQARIGKLALANAAPEAARRIVSASALLMRHDPPDQADAQNALDEFSFVARTAAEPGSTIPVATRAEAWFGVVRAGVALGRVDAALHAIDAAAKQPPFVNGEAADPLLCVLAADAATRSLFERGISTDDPVLLQRAVLEQDALLARADLGLRAESLRPLVFEKLAALAQAAPAGVSLPPAIRLARAITLARDPAQREAAMSAFASVADDSGAGAYAADALWELAVLLTQPPRGTPADRLRASQALLRLAREYPQSAKSQDAVSAALAYTRSLAVDSGDAQMRRDGRGAYLQALATATTAYTSLPNIDLWRYERARLIAEPPAGSAAPGQEELDTALSLLEAIAPGSGIDDDAQRLYERVQTAVLDAAWVKVAEFRKAGDAAGLRDLARDRIVPAATRAASWAAAHGAATLTRFRLDVADGMVESEQAGAKPIYEALLPRAAATPGGEPRIRLGLARAMILAGDPTGAFVHLRKVAAALDAPATGGPVRPELFWHAWSLMLELLADQNKDGARSGSIRAQIKRLEAIDPDLGGEPWAGRVRAVGKRVG